ncbi:MAG: lysozyme [Campylobacteraceae bacterium]|nr:lysozyme [Campylobacteraceae bacterium]
MSIVTGTGNTTTESLVEGKTERLWKPWKLSNQGIAFLGELESGVLNGKNFKGQNVTDGMILKVYNDSRNLPTVGMGHLVLPEDRLRVGDIISLDRAREFVRKDKAIAVKAVNSKVNVPLYQYEFDALVSIVLNAGSGKGATDLSIIVNVGDYVETAEKMKLFYTKSGTTNVWRRSLESKLFSTGVYDAKH